MVEHLGQRKNRKTRELWTIWKEQKNVSDKFYVHKNTKKKEFDSDYSTGPFKADSETKHTVQARKKTFHKKMLADVTKLVDQHPEILQLEKKASANPPKTERYAVRSKATGQFLSPEKTVLTPDTIPHGVAIGTPGTKGTNSHSSQSWEEAKKAAKEKEEKKKVEMLTTSETAQTNTAAPPPTTVLSGPTQANTTPAPGNNNNDPSAAGNNNQLPEFETENTVRRSDRLQTANRTRKYGAILYH